MGIHEREYYQEEGDGVRLDLRNQSMITNLVIINVLIYVANFFTDGDVLMRALASHSSDLGRPLQWWHFLSYGFAHDPRNIMHLVFNMLGLVFLGRDVEQRLGRREFLVFYLLAIIFAGLVSALRYRFLPPAGPAPYVWGASGAVVAVVVLYAFYFPKRQLLFMFLLPMPAWVAAVVFVLVAMFGVGDDVAHDVHLAGAAFGAGYHLLGLRLTGWAPKRLVRRQPKLRVLRPEGDEELEREGDRLLEKLHREGEESLTAKERKVLEKYSRMMRRRRQG